MENLGNDFATTLAAAITTVGQATCTVASSTGAPSPQFRVRIDDELILVTAVSHPTWNITRGIESTTAATHLNGADVVLVLTKGSLEQWNKEFGPLAIDPIVEAGGVRTVPAGTQLMVPNGLVIAGELRLEGEVYL